MKDNLPVVWRAEPHTPAKHAILKRYLDAWIPILSRQSRRVKRANQEILFIDGFAGPGEYENGEPGSPVIALTTALQHSVDFPVPIRFLFIEEDKERFERLNSVLQKYKKQLENSKNVLMSPPEQGECDSILNEMLDEQQKRGTRFGPALAFLDQFGYSAVSMQLIQRILAFPQCEVFSYLDYHGMNRWIGDQSKAPSFDRAWGGGEWRGAINLPELDRREYLLSSYKDALRARATAKYVCNFSMFDKNDEPLYWLIFATNSLRGLEVMKTAMWKVDETGSFKFSDKDNPDQLRLLNEEFDQNWLADELARRLAGKTMTIADIKEFVFTETPCCLFKEALKTLELKKNPGIRVVNSPAKRRPGTFPEEDLKVQFREMGLF
ncbi:MAG: three-Cys-motif partner protein TcmP [Thermoguttaceae bacterium]